MHLILNYGLNNKKYLKFYNERSTYNKKKFITSIWRGYENISDFVSLISRGVC